MPRRSFFFLALAITAVCAVNSLAATEPVDYQKSADSASWEWQPEQASVLYSTILCPKEYKVEIIRPQNTFGELTIRFYHDDRLDGTIEGHAYTTFVVDESILYYAEYRHSTTGCALVAYDLKTRKELWKTQLEGIGPIHHFRYTNMVVVTVAQGAATAPLVILMRGSESAGKYIEYVDTKTHKTVGHKIFEKGFKDTGPMEPR